MEPASFSTLMGHMLAKVGWVLGLGSGRLIQDALLILQCGAVTGAIVAGIVTVWSGSVDVGALGKKFFLIAALSTVVKYWKFLVNGLRTGAIALGLAAGGGDGFSVADFLDPGLAAEWGVSIAGLVTKRQVAPGIMGSIENYAGAFLHPGQTLLSEVALILLVLSSFAISVYIFQALLEYLLVASIALILVPFGAFQKTSFLAEKAFAALMSHAIKLLVLACVLSAVLPLMVTVQLPANPTYEHVFQLVFMSWIVLSAVLSSNRITNAFLSGHPSLHQAHIAQSLRMLASVTMGATQLLSRARPGGGGGTAGATAPTGRQRP